MGIRFEEAPATPAKKRGHRDNAEEVAGLYLYDPRKLHVQEGWNSRAVTFSPDDEEDIALARSIAEVGVKQPLTAFLQGGVAYLTDGHRRLAATLYAMDTLGADIKTVPVQSETKLASEADRVLSQLVRNQGKPLAPIEKASVFAKLIGFGWSEAEIAKKVGLTRQRVVDLLTLRAGPQAVVEMVTAGEVSAGLALETIRAEKGDGAAATEKLYAGLQKARAEGKTKATAKHVDRPTPDLRKSVGYSAGMKRAVEIVRGAWEPDEIPSGILTIIEKIEAEIVQ